MPEGLRERIVAPLPSLAAGNATPEKEDQDADTAKEPRTFGRTPDGTGESYPMCSADWAESTKIVARDQQTRTR